MPQSITQKVIKLILILALGALTALIAGCTTVQEKRIPTAMTLEPIEGLVALRITTNHPFVTSFAPKWDNVRVKNIETAKISKLVNRSDTYAEHSLIMGSLPAGLYEIEQLESPILNGGSASATVRDALPKFRVVSGQLTDLGTLAYIRVLNANSSSKFWLAQADSALDSAAVLKKLDPTLSAKLASSPVNTWEAGEKLKSLRAAYPNRKSLTMRAMSPVRGPDGTLYVGESFGQIMTRRSSGVWKQIETPTTLPVRTVHVDASGTIYAGSDDGALMVRRQPSGRWDTIALPVNDTSIVHIGALPGSGRVFVVLLTRDRFIGLTLDNGSETGFREEFSRARETGLAPESGHVWANADRFVLALFSTAKFIDVGSPGTEGKVWQFSKIDELGVPTSWAIAPGGSIGRYQGHPLIQMYFSISQDGGLTWEKRSELDIPKGSPLLVTNKTFFALTTPSRVVETLFSNELKESMVRSDDAGRTWSKVGPTPNLSGQLMSLDGTESRLAYVSPFGAFFVSGDGGKNWHLERLVE